MLWKTDSVLNKNSPIWCSVAVADLGRWIVQQGYAKTLVPVTKRSIIQVEEHILQTLGWHLDPPTVTAAARIILKRFFILTEGQFGSNAADLQQTTDKYVREVIMTHARSQYPTVKLARGAVALSLASVGLLPQEGSPSIVPESAQHTWREICTVAFGTKTFLGDMVELGRFLDTRRHSATSSNHWDSKVKPRRSVIQRMHV